MAENHDEGRRNFWERLLTWKGIQTIGFAILTFFGVKIASSKEAGEQTKQSAASNFLMRAFPSLTSDDETEYAEAINSHKNQAARIIAREFYANLKKDPIYDEEKYRIRIIELRRKFAGGLRCPAPKDDSGGRIKYEILEIRDSVIDFMDQIATTEENGKKAGKSPEEIYKIHKQIGIDQNFLEEKHAFKQISENKLLTLALLLALIGGLHLIRSLLSFITHLL